MLGDRLGNWVIYKELGRGGMGRVYLARGELNGRLAAIKVLAAQLAQETGFLHRFQREIEALSKLEHPNIVRFYESDCENGTYYYAMEYVEGTNLEKVLEEKDRLTSEEILDIALQICPALKHAHDHGVIHRDIKPPNLLQTPEGIIKLSDFGIAKIFAGGHLTATGGIVGTADYISPEQAAGKPATKRSDLYSLGIVLYRMATGRLPFEGSSALDLLHKHRYAQFDAPEKIVHGFPYELNEVICQMLAKDPADRPADARVLARQLEKIKAKLERKSAPTNPGLPQGQTHADFGRQRVIQDKEGPATLMSRLMREELEDQKRGGMLKQFFNKPVVLVISLLLCVGLLVWAFWPLSAETLYERGAALMQSEYLSDWETARRDYFEPLNENYPDHPYKKQVDQWIQDIKERRERSDNPMTSEGERFYEKGQRLYEEGDVAGAKKTWNNLIAVFASVKSEKEWVNQAKKGLIRLEKDAKNKERWEPVREALKQAKELHEQGKTEEAEKIWNGIESLYLDDPAASQILQEIQEARKKK